MQQRDYWFIAALALFAGFAPMATAQDVQLNITGAEDTLLPVLRSASLTVALAGDDRTASPQDYVAAARADYRRLLTGLYAQGYFGGSISIRIDGREAANIAPLDAPSRISTVAITITPGPLFTFGQAQIAPLPDGTILPDGFTTGAPAGSEMIRAAAITGVEAWRDLGYAKATPDGQEITADHPDARLDVAIHLDTGPQLTFGTLIVEGNVDVRTARVIEIAGLQQGAQYSPDALAAAAARLRRSGAFASVVLNEAEGISPGQTLDITAQVAEQIPRRFGIGAEISSVQGISVNGYWLHRNLLGGAERLRLGVDITGIAGATGGIDAALTADFARPATFRPDLDLTITIALSHLDEPDYLRDAFSIETGLTRVVLGDLTLTGGPGLLTAREETALGSRGYTLLTFPMQAVLDRRDDPIDAKNGFYIDLQVTPFMGLSGAADGMRLYADARYYHSFGEADKVTLAARGQVGLVLGAGITTAPADFLFYSGGGGTVRGQPYQSLGIGIPTADAPDARTGGASFLGAQLETRVQITDTIGLVGFYDIGLISADSVPGEDSLWQAGAGFGLRYNTAIGPIRLDVATPASGPDAGRDIQFYVGLGQSF